MANLQIKLPSALHPITVEPTEGRVTVRLGGRVVAESTRSLTLREASYPPVQYLPLEDVEADALVPSDRTSYCPFKGTASYYSLRAGDAEAPDSVWTYVSPHDAVAPIAGHVAFYADRVDSVEISGAEPS
jgi:uncharacterized protein (DUF427 family)